jgi:hypothetical protein
MRHDFLHLACISNISTFNAFKGSDDGLDYDVEFIAERCLEQVVDNTTP